VTEEQALEWLYQHWPSLGIAALLAATYIRLWRFNRRVLLLQNRLERILDVCSGQHPELGAKLYRENVED
jgi:hypothetical protein